MKQLFETYNNLRYRRQFLLGPLPFRPTEHWNCLDLEQGLILSVHPELEVSSKSQDGISITLIGFAVDPLNPRRTMSDIVSALMGNSSGIGEVIDLTYSLAGRWLVIFQDHKGTYLFTDPCGFRSVFYHKNDLGIWCGSQPEIIKAVNILERDVNEELLHFMMSQNMSRTESAWVGSSTPYANCYHLMPNHYLRLNQIEQVRFFPDRVQRTKEKSSIIETATLLLQGIINAIVSQKKVTQALTAGWDSRVLLAASKPFSHKIEYFVDCQGVLSEKHQDIWIPKRLARKLNLNLTVKNSIDDPPGWFVSMLANNVTGARVLPKSRTIYAHFITGESRININGNGSEICRNFYDKYRRIKLDEISNADLADMLGYNNIDFVEHELEEWRKGLHSFGGRDATILDMLYWEQRLGNWGAQYPAEQDIAIEEFSPFNCRLLIETLLATPRSMRIAPSYSLYRELIQAMWPELLLIPVNPGPNSLFHRLKKQMWSYIPSSIVRLLNK